MGVARSRGNAGEALVAAYLELCGIEVVQRNVRLAGVEVDLLAVDGGCRVVVEVKYRGRADYGGAAAAIDRIKQARLIRAARALEQDAGVPYRIDVVTVQRTEDGAVLRHVRNAVTE